MTSPGRLFYWLGPDKPDPDVTPELAGSKAAGIWRMANLGLPTPPAFVLPTSFSAEVNRDPDKATALVEQALRGGMERLEEACGRRFGDSRKPLLVSVRSGAARSMPGMLSTVLNVGMGREAARGLIQQTGDPRFAWDSYRRFLESYAVVVGGVSAAAFGEVLASLVEAEGARDESELDGEALERLTEQYAEIALRDGDVPDNPTDQLREAALAVFRSWESPKAREYRRLNGLEDLAGTAVTVQAMVFGNGGQRSGSGVAFTRNPATGEAGLYLDFLFDAQGEDVVSGRRTPLSGAELAGRLPDVFQALSRGGETLERAFADVQDIEFTIEDGALHFLQTRSAKRTPRAALRIAVDLEREGRIDRATALERLAGVDRGQMAVLRFAAPATALGRGVGAASGVASGRAAFDSSAAKRLAADGEPVILVRREPATEDIEGFAAAAGILTCVGGRTAHASVVARQMGKVCVVGCAELSIAADDGSGELAGQALGEGDWISLDGDSGEVTLGRREVVRVDPVEDLAELDRWAAAIAEAGPQDQGFDRKGGGRADDSERSGTAGRGERTA
jgi:pyruvate,orthophosphate dikinase